MPSALDPEPRLRPRAAPACLSDPSTPCEPTGQTHPGPYGTRSTESPAWLTQRPPDPPAPILPLASLSVFRARRAS